MNTSSSPVWHPFTQHALVRDFPEIAKAEGAYLFDRDGKRYFDGISSWWVTTHGHCYPRIQKAIQAQAETLDQVIFADLTHAAAEALARGLLALAPDGLDKVFFTDSGSTSVEVAIKMALGYWTNIGAPRHRVVVMENSYHGDTVGAMSVGARGVFNQAYAPLLFDVASIPFPAAGRETATLDALEDFCRGGDERPACFVVEPLILGAGGMLIYPPEVLRALRDICARYDVLFIADEVMTGWGRTGTLFATEQAGVAPDLLCTGKGLTGGSIPLAATLATGRIFEAHLSADRTKTFFHSSSFTANPLACAAALENVRIWEDEPVLERVAALTRWQTAALKGLERHSMVAEVRQLGTIGVCDVRAAQAGYLSAIGPDMRDAFRRSGVLLRPLGNTLYVMPPYCTREDDLRSVYDEIGRELDKFAAAEAKGAR